MLTSSVPCTYNLRLHELLMAKSFQRCNVLHSPCVCVLSCAIKCAITCTIKHVCTYYPNVLRHDFGLSVSETFLSRHSTDWEHRFRRVRDGTRVHILHDITNDYCHRPQNISEISGNVYQLPQNMAALTSK